MAQKFDQLSDYIQTREIRTGRRFLKLRCTNYVARQAERAIGSTIIGRLPVAITERAEWTHWYHMRGPLTPKQRQVLELLKRVETIRIGPPPLVAVALDRYKDPQPDVDPMNWPNTEVGELINRGKYHDDNSAGRELASRLTSLIKSHPDFMAASTIIAVPSHSPRRFGERLAAAVAKRTALDLVTPTDSDPGKGTVKESPRSPHSYSIPLGALDGQRVIVLDDVYRTGGSVRAVAEAAALAGASDVCVVVGACTLRN